MRAEVGAQHSLVLPPIVQRPFLWAAQWAARGCWPIFCWIFGIHFKTVAFWKIWFHSKCVCGFPGLPHTGAGCRLAQGRLLVSCSSAIHKNFKQSLCSSKHKQSSNRAPCAENDKINVTDEPCFGTHIVSNYLPFQTSEIPKKNTQPLISIRGLAFNGLLRSSEK